MINKKPRIAVVGTGWWATEFHIPSLKKYESCELVALVDPNKDKRQKAQTMLSFLRRTSLLKGPWLQSQLTTMLQTTT